ncbi:MAG: HAD-IC family P-type ATPase [Candidatus Yonathbacteria bacterium]|nr:HAD-IC family P-type ATPase [Candidatus Yonathbacteria bacterium]
MDFSEYTNTDIASVATLFSVNTARGLSSAEVDERRKKYGANRLDESAVSPFKIFLRQFKSSFIYLLLAAMALSFFLGELTDGWMIIIFLLINTSLGFYQEYRSEKTVELLKKYIKTRAKVRRDGKIIAVLASDLVPGDIVVIEAGDSVPSDIRIVEDLNLSINEEPLTGESVPAKKDFLTMEQKTDEPYEAKNICFSGTTVVSGRGAGIVFATGAKTMIGDIARMTGEMTRESKFEQELGKFSKFILYLVIGTLTFIFAANLIIKGWRADIAELAIFSIALAVSVVPEALPVVMTFSLSRGARRLAKNKVVVKRLSAIEDLGSIEVLCSDKTGTLTENKLTVCKTCGITDESADESPDFVSSGTRLGRELISEAIFAANMGGSYLAIKERGQNPDPFDVALWEALDQADQTRLTAVTRLRDIPFDPVRKKSSALLEENGQTILVVRGAPESILEVCDIDPAKHARILAWMAHEGREGRRVLAVASKKISSSDYQSEGDEKNLTFIGCISFIDPIKDSVREAIREAQKLNVAIKIITGDGKEVAGQVAFEVGLARNHHDVLTAHEFFALSEDEQNDALARINVFARVSPEQKYKIIELIQKKYQVGFLGEGINDAPALKIANVAIVVQSASDIAREVADIILLERSLGAVIGGIREGRAIFANTIKYIRSSLSSNFGNFYSVAISSLFIPFLPMLPLQILLVNLLSDFPAIAIASDNVDHEELREPKQYNVRKIIMFGTALGIVSTVFDFIIFASFYKLGVNGDMLQTHWFIESILTELIFLFSIRSKGWFFKTIKPSTPLILLTALAFITTITLPFTAFGQSMFHFVRPSMGSLSFVLAIVATYFVTTEIAKVLYYRVTSSPLVHQK